MKKNSSILSFAVLLIIFITSCQKEKQVTDWIPVKVQVNPVKLTGEGPGESQNMDLLVDQTIKVMENRLKMFDVKNFEITKVPDFKDQIVIKIPLWDIVVKRGKTKVKISLLHLIYNLCAYPEYKIELKLCAYGPEPLREYLMQYFGGEIPENMEIVSGTDKENRLYYEIVSETDKKNRLYYAVIKNVIVSNKDFSDGEVFTNKYGEIGIKFKLKNEGANKLKEVTSKNIGKKMALLVDGRVIFAATILDKLSKEVLITGEGNSTQKMILAVLMKTGSLPDHLVLPTTLKVFETKLKINIKFGSETEK